MGVFTFFSENIFIRAVYFSAIVSLCFSGYDVLAQTSEMPDLRNPDCVNCKGQANNFSILNAYFSNASGDTTDICSGTGPYFLSILYTSNQKNSVHNFRLIADIQKKNRITNQILNSFYLNYFSGTVSSCDVGACFITIPIPDLGFDCKDEYYELSNPMSFWTPNAKDNLKDSYKCNDYPTAQCSHSTSIPIGVGSLIYDFDVDFECFQENFNQTNVGFFINTLFGGDPTQAYDVNWHFAFSDGTHSTSTEFNPTLPSLASGQEVTATLTINQAPLTGKSITSTITIPMALNGDDVIDSSVIIDSEEGKNNGSIEVTFKPGDFFYFWTSLDDPDFYSEEAKIENLPEGTYVLTTFDADTGLCRTDVFDIIFSILPVELMYFNANLNLSQNTIELNWATAQEWESSHFEVMRSFDNLDNWQKIGEMKAAGFSDQIQEYAFEDNDNFNFYQIAYYQLNQIDIDQTFDYSEVISVHLPNSFDKDKTWTVYPNPIDQESANLILSDQNTYDGGTITATLVNPFGSSTVFSGNVSTLSEQLNQAISQSAKGVYILHLVWGKHDQQIKILKR